MNLEKMVLPEVQCFGDKLVLRPDLRERTTSRTTNNEITRNFNIGTWNVRILRQEMDKCDSSVVGLS